MAPWADALFAMDYAWWVKHIEEVRRDFVGQRFSTNGLPADFGVTLVKQDQVGNSGAGAIRLAILGGAARVIMLGFDCQHTGGQRHWHGDHPRGLGNACVFRNWPKHFKRILSMADGVEIVNASRATALDVFPRVDLERALE